MASPDTGLPREESLARPAGPGDSALTRVGAAPAALALLPDHQQTSDADLLAALHNRDPLAFVEVYQRTAPAAHAIARRLLGRIPHVEAALRLVYADLWLTPPSDGSLVQWVRSRCFAVASIDLRHRAAPPGEPSVLTILEDLPPPTVHHVSRVERALAALPPAVRRAVLLAHDAGVASAEQADPEAAALLEAGLLVLGDPDSALDVTAPPVGTMGDWALGLLTAADAEVVAAAVAADPQLAARATRLHAGRRRLEGLPASPNTSQRILGHVLATSVASTPAALPAESRRRPPTGGVGLVAASLVLVLVAGVLLLTSRYPANTDLAVAQAPAPRPVPTATAPEAPAPPARSARMPRMQSSPEPRIVRPAQSAPQAQPAAPPVRVTVPRMQVDRRLVGLSVLNDGTLAAPEDFDTPGWYREGVAPGDAGPAVIVGHVDSLEGPAVFFKLETLRPGDKAHVKRSDGTTVTFVIDSVRRVPKDDFPTQQVYGPTQRPELRLITCGGAFDNTTRSYDDNVIAFASLEQAKQAEPKAGGVRRRRPAKPDARGAAGSQQPTTYDHLGRPVTPRRGGEGTGGARRPPPDADA